MYLPNKLISSREYRILRTPSLEVLTISFGSKYFGWLAAFVIVLGLGWFLLPDGWNTVVAMFAPQFGNYMRPTVVFVSILLVNPLTNLVGVAIWAGAGLVGGILAGTKKGAFVVGFITWISTLVLFVFCAFMLITTGFDTGSLPSMPPGYSIADILGIPLIQDLVGSMLGMIGGMTGGSVDILALVLPLLVWVFAPVIIIIIAGMIGATIRPKE